MQSRDWFEKRFDGVCMTNRNKCVKFTYPVRENEVRSTSIFPPVRNGAHMYAVVSIF